MWTLPIMSLTEIVIASFCIDCNTISSVVWCKEGRVNFSKTAKLHKPVGLNTSPYLFQITRTKTKTNF